VAAAAGVIATALLLGGCGAEPVPAPRPRDAATAPVMLDVQVERVRDQVLKAVAAGDEAQDPAALEPRVAGPALELRKARYVVRGKLADQPAPAPVDGELLTEITPAAAGWPHFYLTASRREPAAAPQLQLLTQPAPRDPYRLTATATLLPRTTLPKTADVPEAIPAGEAADLVASPADVLARYGDVLTRGADSKAADQFADDAFRGQVLAEQKAEQGAVKEFFNYSTAHEPRPDSVWAVRTEDGGAIVLGVLSATRTFTVKTQGAKLPLTKDLAALADTDAATKEAKVTSLEVVVFQVPPKGSDSKIAVLAGDRGLVSVTAS
jgi:hypothetical protein